MANTKIDQEQKIKDLETGILVAYIKDLKADGVDGGDFNSGAWRTRDLNTLFGDTSFISIDGVSKFTLQPGTYDVLAEAPGYFVNSHQAKLRNFTDSVDVDGGVGMRADASTTSVAMTNSVISVSVTITVPTTYEIQHRCQSTASSSGFGTSGAVSFGVSSIYTMVKITKLNKE